MQGSLLYNPLRYNKSCTDRAFKRRSLDGRDAGFARFGFGLGRAEKNIKGIPRFSAILYAYTYEAYIQVSACVYVAFGNENAEIGKVYTA